MPLAAARGYGRAVTPSRFASDSSLAALARWLRFLGYDVATFRGARLDELLAAAREGGRIALTLSARHPRRYADVPVLRVPRDQPDQALREIVRAHAPSSPPFGRCPECNHALERRHPLQATGEVPGRVLRGATSLRYCPSCAKWYWEGTHVARIRAALERALGRPVAPAPESAGPQAADD